MDAGTGRVRAVAAARCPAVLLLSWDHDDRVDPMHARRFTAALQAAAGPGPVWLRIEQNAGHGGADVIKQRIEDWADSLSFVMSQLGMVGVP